MTMDEPRTPPSDTGAPRAPERGAIIARFTQWLDSVLEDELPPEGVAPELMALLEDGPVDDPPEACGDYEIWSTLTALTQEVKTQGRTFRDLTEAMAPVQSSLERLAERPAEDSTAPLREAIAALQASQADAKRAAADAAWGDVLDILLDMRDRLYRGCEGLRSTLTHARGAFETRRMVRLVPGVSRSLEPVFEAVSAAEQGNALLLERLDESLARMGVHEIPAANRPFDAATMKAVDVETRDDMPEGAVSAVLRCGYMWRGDVYRLAEVRVSRRIAPPNEDPHS